MLLIGFEQHLYEFPETMEIIYRAVIIKVGGTITEQTYLIDVSASDGTALNKQDYDIGEATQRFTIRPDQQIFQFPFEIPEDIILEQVECFTLSLENVPGIEPRFETQGTITTTRIEVLDGTRKITSNLYM